MSESTSVKLPDGTRDRLRAAAQRKRRTPNWLMREAIDQYLTRDEAEAQFAEDARKALAEYRATGLHVTNEEAMEWLDKLSRGEDAEMPKPHK